MLNKRDYIRWLKKGAVFAVFRFLEALVIGAITLLLIGISVSTSDLFSLKAFSQTSRNFPSLVILLVVAFFGVIINGFIIEKTNEVIKK